ncbi:MAG: hypothetical protein WCO68_09660 [Verrucomicrobiota bacterium]
MAASQSKDLQKVGECLYRNSHGTFFAWFSIHGKQIKRSLKTMDKTLARRRLAELREKGNRLHGNEQRNIQFEELVAYWLESIRSDVKESTYRRRIVCLNQLAPISKKCQFARFPFRSLKNGRWNGGRVWLRARSTRNWRR